MAGSTLPPESTATTVRPAVAILPASTAASATAPPGSTTSLRCRKAACMAARTLVVACDDPALHPLHVDRKGKRARLRCEECVAEALGPRAGQPDAAASLQRHGVVVVALRFGGVKVGLRPGIGDGERRAGHQPAAAGGHDHGIGPAANGAALPDDLVPHGSLAGDDVEIVEGLDQCCAPLCSNLDAERLARLAGAVVEHDFGAVAAGTLDFHRRRIPRHDDDRRHADELGRSRHRLGMVAGGISHHASGLGAWIELQQPVAGTPGT